MARGEVHPIGVLSDMSGQADFEARSLELRQLVGKLRIEPEIVAHYLQSGAMVLAWMESTTDMLEARFRVPGGSAIRTDGTYYWRNDAARYVIEYAIDLRPEFITHASALDWQCPEVSADRVLEIDDFLTNSK